jgi:hypothetical protein
MNNNQHFSTKIELKKEWNDEALENPVKKKEKKT